MQLKRNYDLMINCFGPLTSLLLVFLYDSTGYRRSVSY